MVESSSKDTVETGIHMKENGRDTYEGYWLAAGTILHQRYRIQDTIAEGGIGIVYIGYDLVLQTVVSIKEYFPRRYAMRMSPDPMVQKYRGSCEQIFQDGLKKFITEARVLAQFEALDSIVSVKDFFYENQTGYMVMEYIEGRTIKEIVEQEGRIEPETVLQRMHPVLQSLAVLHKQQLLHRDIAPDNLIEREDGKYILVDFGTARFLNAEEQQTMTIFYKKGYSAGEQYAPHTQKGAYTDIYGICATMYYMLTGIVPEESVRRILCDKVVPLSDFRDIELPKRTKAAIMKGMAVDQKKRYPDLDALCRELYREADDAGEKKQNKKRQKPVGRSKQRRIKAVTAAVVLTVLTGISFYGIQSSRQTTQHIPKPAGTQIFVTGNISQRTQEPQTTSQTVADRRASATSPAAVKHVGKEKKVSPSQKRTTVVPKQTAAARVKKEKIQTKSRKTTPAPSATPKKQAAKKSVNPTHSPKPRFAGTLPTDGQSGFAGHLPTE